MPGIERKGNKKYAAAFLIAVCIAIFVWTTALPVCRAFLTTEIDYNEGWNVYNAQKVAQDQQLYPSTYAWTTVNYPPLSFHLIAALGNSAKQYLFAGRALSLIGLCLSALFAGLIVYRTTQSKPAAWLSGFFLVALFCATASGYVGMDDPQMLAQAFFMAGLYVYLRSNRQGWPLDLTALLFVVGGNIKHNLIEFPLAVFIDLILTAPRKALRFAASGVVMAAISVVATRQVDGAAYISCLLTARSYSASSAIHYLLFLPLQSPLPTCAALWTAFVCWKDSSRRVLSLLFFCALGVDTYFCGGNGVDINGLFGSMLAMALLSGIFWVKYSRLPTGKSITRSPLIIGAIFFIGLALPMFLSGNERPDKIFAQNREEARRFAVEVAYLRQQPGEALCESLLRCALAGKPYVYDPFNATRFIEQGKLDPNVIVEQLKNHAYGAVQLYDSVEDKLADRDAQSTFVPTILRAIDRYDQPGLDNEDGVIYLPKGHRDQVIP